MKNIRGFALGLVLGLGVALGGLAFAQNTSDQKQKADSCCAMACCCCCKGDSCGMMKDQGKSQSDKHECCCGGDSCNMKDMKHKKEMKTTP